MWTILKSDKKKIKLLKEDFKSKLGNDVVFYQPKVLIHRYKKKKLIKKEVELLDDYIFCYHYSFKNLHSTTSLKFSRGLKYFLVGSITAQDDISGFVENCKEHENRNGYITHNIFDISINSFYKFKSGPFVEKIFKIVSLQKNKIDILMGEIKTTINKKDYLFSSV